MSNDPTVSHALDSLTPEAAPDVDGAWQRQLALQSRIQDSGFRILSWPHQLPTSKFQIPIAAALILAVAFFAAPVRGLAAQFLTIFRVQDVTPITVDRVTQPLPDLSRLGDMSPSPREVRLQPVQVESLSAASSRVGFNVQAPRQLPAGLPSQPSVIAVSNGATVNFTFRAQKAAAYLASSGHKDFSLPPKFDGATLTLRVPPAASLAYLPSGTSLADLQQAASSEQVGGKPDSAAINRLLNGSGALLIEARSPELDATGVSAEELRDFLLSLPGIPEDTKAQLRSIGDWRNTLPVPASPGSNLHKVSVNGAPGVAGRNGSGEMVLWVKNGLVFVATGPKLDEKVLLALASSVG